MTVRRPDFREVRPTTEERAAWAQQHPNRPYPPTRAEHRPCGKRIWYVGIAIGAHVKACHQ